MSEFSILTEAIGRKTYDAVKGEVENKEELQSIRVSVGPGNQGRWSLYSSDDVFDNVFNRREAEESSDPVGQVGGELRSCPIRICSEDSPSEPRPCEWNRARFYTYSLAKTPLKAAQAPLATANNIHPLAMGISSPRGGGGGLEVEAVSEAAEAVFWRLRSMVGSSPEASDV